MLSNMRLAVQTPNIHTPSPLRFSSAIKMHGENKKIEVALYPVILFCCHLADHPSTPQRTAPSKIHQFCMRYYIAKCETIIPHQLRKRQVLWSALSWIFRIIYYTKPAKTTVPPENPPGGVTPRGSLPRTSWGGPAAPPPPPPPRKTPPPSSERTPVPPQADLREMNTKKKKEL